jgi:methionyl-tRNA formyltransferase
MRILFLGTPDFSVPPLEALHGSGHDIVLVVSRPDMRRGRGRRPSPTPLKAAALRMGLPVYQPQTLNDAAAVERLRQAQPEIGVVVAYGDVLKHEVLAAPRDGFLNLHASLLPKYRGAAPINWAIISGEKETGVSVQRMARELDAGAILAQQSVAIGDDDTAGELHDRLCERGAVLLLDVVQRLSRGEALPEHPQDPAQASYAPKLTKKDGRIEWHQTAVELRNRVRGLTPWPGAFCRFAGQGRTEDVIVLQVALGPGRVGGVAPGTVLSANDREGILVQAGEGTVIIEKLKPASGRAMTAADYVHGRAVGPGHRFV